ncbi:hypothetical protein P171DRAFT_339878, partial [Karstenula rhodostoma CBS 690.94]
LLTASETADRVVHALVHTEKRGTHLKRTLDTIVSASSWTENLAEWVLAKLETPAKEAYDQACSAALAIPAFVKDHPVSTTDLALGVLVVLAPWVLEVLGFAELGPVSIPVPHDTRFVRMAEQTLSSFAAAWQARYAGYVAEGSLFSFLLRLGMVWH